MKVCAEGQSRGWEPGGQLAYMLTYQPGVFMFYSLKLHTHKYTHRYTDANHTHTHIYTNQAHIRHSIRETL